MSNYDGLDEQSNHPRYGRLRGEPGGAARGCLFASAIGAAMWAAILWLACQIAGCA